MTSKYQINTNKGVINVRYAYISDVDKTYFAIQKKGLYLI